MQHAIYGADPTSASVAILVKETSFNSEKIKTAYIDPLGANPAGFIAYSLWYDDNDKCPAALAKEHLQTVLCSTLTLGIKTILVTDAKYFKYLTGKQKTATDLIGYAVKSGLQGYENKFDVFYAPNYNAAKYNPHTDKEMSNALGYLKQFLSGTYEAPGSNVIHSAQYPMTLGEIATALEFLHTKPALTVDIEARGLDFWTCGIATIAFAWDKHNFISFPVDRGSFPSTDLVINQPFNSYVKHMLMLFFENYKGKLIPHNGGYDFKVLTYELWMKNLQDYVGMIQGIKALTRDFDDTKLITYLATNNAVENVLKLKVLSADYLGNYAEEDIGDTDKIPLDRLLEYNGKDCLAGWHVYNKYHSVMVKQDQLKIYEELFKPSLITLLQTELVGMPIFPDEVARVKKTLTDLRSGYQAKLDNSKLIMECQLEVKAKKCEEFTAAAKKKVFNMDDPRITRLGFNPNSGQQVANLLYNYLKFPIIDTTDTGQPATGGDTLEKLLHHTQNLEYIAIIKSLIGLAQVDKILTSFIPAFEKAVQMPDGSWRLYGNFNLGGTVSGRLSCVAPWTPIITNRGEIPIYQVKIGDYVYTHKGNWKPVINTIYKGLDYMVNIRLCNGKIFTCTTDHKVLLSSGEWKTIKEILNVNIQSMGNQSNKCNSNSTSLPVIKKWDDYGKYCYSISNHSAQYFSCVENEYVQRRTCCNKSSKILGLKNRRQKPYQGKVQRTAPKLERRVFRLQRLSDYTLQRQKSFCSSSSNDGTSGTTSVTGQHDRASYRQQSVEQCIRQSCIDYQFRTQNTSLFAGAGQPGIEIKEINYCGSTPVYDLTVADDESYLSCGFYSHNSSNPNLQNLPATSIWGKFIKSCFGCITGWLFGGADFNSLEDMVAALTTRDTNKMAVYLDGFDGHSIRAYSYFKDDMPDLQQAVTAGRKFKITLDGQTNILTADTMVLCPDGNQRPIGEYYDKHRVA
jgi:DNA polymerase I-like protein with 3'-5' exonuclease and polymerase domains